MKRPRKKLCWLLLFMMLFITGMGSQISAASLENVLKAPKAAAGKLVTDKKGVRYYNSGSKTYTKNKWVKVREKIYYFTSNGYAKTGWKTYHKKRYYFNKKGKLATGWQTIGRKKYYLWKNKADLSGSAATGKVKMSTGWYYFSGTGVMQTGWNKIGGSWYYFSPVTGKMAVNTTIGNYKVDKNGKRVNAVSDKTTDTAPKKSGKVDYWVGDSRTVGLGISMGISKKCIAKVREGHNWYLTTAEKKLKKELKKNPKATVVLNFGVNDHVNITKYINSYKKLLKAYPEANIYFMSVNPIDSKYTAGYVSNAKINSFNKKLKAAFPQRYIDVNSYLKKKGFKTVDGLHYTAATYKKIYNYVLSKV